MRSIALRSAMAFAIVAALGAANARAQSNPGIDEIVKSLTPTPSAPGTRGIRVGNPEVSLNILFATGSADLTPQAVQTLDDLGRALTNPALAAYRFRVEGHTDTVGSRDYNKALSNRRAIAVVEYLVGKFQVDRNRLQPVGMGEDGLVVQTPDQTPEPRNRRVLVINIGS